jgi:hypothetical protein
LVVTLGSALRVLGYWRLWLAWGVPSQLAAECGIVSVLARPFSGYFGNAYVADVLQAAVVPWLALLVWRWRELRSWQCAALVAILALGVGVKLSVLVAVMSMLVGVVAEEMRACRAAGWRRVWVAAFKAVAVFLAVKLLWDWGYLRRGASIEAGGPLNYLQPEVLTQPLAGPLFSALGVQSLLNRILIFPGAPLLTPAGMWPCFLAGTFAATAVVVTAWREFPSRGYVIQLSVWLIVYGAVFIWFYATRAAVSFEERHYLPAGLLLLPCTVFALRYTGGRVWRWAGTGVLAGLCGYGLASFASNARHRAVADAVGRYTFTHTTLTRVALAELHRIDDETTAQRVTFYVTMPEIALEVQRGRAITIPVDSWSENFVRSFRFVGRVPRLVLVLPGKFAGNGKVDLVEHEFPDYHVWQAREVGGFLFIEGG